MITEYEDSYEEFTNSWNGLSMDSWSYSNIPQNATLGYTNITTQMPSSTAINDVALFRTIIEAYLCLPIALAGIIGNILSIIVLANHKPLQSTTVVLEAIAVTDTAVLVSTLTLRSFRYIDLPGYDTAYRYIFIWMYPLTFFIRLANTWLTVLLTVDRYIAVCHPLRAQQLCTLSRTRLFILFITIFSILFTIPRCFEYELVDFSVHPHGFRYSGPLSENQPYIYIYRISIFFIIMYLAPMTLLVVLNTKLLVALHRSQAYRASKLRFHQPKASVGSQDGGRNVCYSRELQGRSGAGGQGPGPRSGSDDQLCRRGGHDPSRATRTITMIAVTVVLISVMCNISAMISHVLYSLNEGFKIGTDKEIYRRILSNISNLFITINSAVNFLIYCFYSRKFRIVLARLVRSKLNRCARCRKCLGLVPIGYEGTDLYTGSRTGSAMLTGTTDIRSRGVGRYNFSTTSTRQSIYSTRVSLTSIKLTSYKSTPPIKRDSLGHAHGDDVMMARISESSSPPP